MKWFYLFLAAVSLALLLAIPIVYVEKPSVSRWLIEHPEQWDLKFNTPDGKLVVDATQAKARLLTFMRAERKPPYLLTPDAVWLQIVLLFGLAGWWRERSRSVIQSHFIAILCAIGVKRSAALRMFGRASISSLNGLAVTFWS